jgi:hypothetical protein
MDSLSATNPPMITLHWPQNGTQIAGNSFSWRGLISDPNVTITAVSVATDGSTNIVQGVMERDGSFWLYGLPLHGGTNSLSLIASNASGLSTTTNITVVKSDSDRSHKRENPRISLQLSKGFCRSSGSVI